MSRHEKLLAVVIVFFMIAVALVAIYFRNTSASALEASLKRHVEGGPHAGVVDSLGDHEIRLRELERIVKQLREAEEQNPKP